MKSSIHSTSSEGWLIVTGLAAVLCVSFGTTLNSLGVFTLPLTSTFHCSNEEAARIATVFLLAMTIAMPVAGWLLDWVSPRPVMTSGAILIAAGFLVAAQSPDINVLTLAIGLSGVGVGASTYVPAITLASRWVPAERQGLAFGILLAGAAVGAVIFPMLVTFITERFGWRMAMQAIAATVILTCVPLLIWLARMPQGAPAESGGSREDEAAAGHRVGEALRMPRYWLWIVMLTLITLSTLGVYIALVPYLVSSGYSASDAASVYAFIGAATFAGNFLFGSLSNRWGAKAILLLGTALSAVGIVCLLWAHDPVHGFVAVALFSLIWGSTFNLANQLSPLLLSQAMGQRNFGSLLGIGNLISGLGSAFSPDALGYLVDTTHTYRLALILCAALLAVALLPIAMLRHAPAWEHAK
ncbi:MFS transporter [Paraburkholderia ginsengiterrae]|uniref:MFS transporter n=1 Tax=Paraburkholderia ginsengiterrae TaxID=1462993 RepID=A0A1A9N0G9_9BURK|nr:MFS transporter [Paraburkholderia ginsengiterrae]OAJ54469.1 MFS transporter [Paraburkholderia ginsengiterrae]OAJ56279.1 MFS transporter [Paraburkholderia ginsengiterrae]